MSYEPTGRMKGMTMKIEWMPLHMAQRMAQARDASTTQEHGVLKVHRRGEYLGALEIVDECVSLNRLSKLLAMLWGQPRPTPQPVAPKLEVTPEELAKTIGEAVIRETSITLAIMAKYKVTRK